MSNNRFRRVAWSTNPRLFSCFCHFERVKVEKRALYHEIEQRILEEVQVLQGGDRQNTRNIPVDETPTTVKAAVADTSPTPLSSSLSGLTLSTSIMLTFIIVGLTRLNHAFEFLEVPVVANGIVLGLTVMLLTHLTVKYEKGKRHAKIAVVI